MSKVTQPDDESSHPSSPSASRRGRTPVLRGQSPLSDLYPGPRQREVRNASETPQWTQGAGEPVDGLHREARQRGASGPLRGLCGRHLAARL